MNSWQLRAAAAQAEQVVYQSEDGGSIPGSSDQHVEVSLGKILNPKLLPMAVPLMCECACMSSGWTGLLFVEKPPCR